MARIAIMGENGSGKTTIADYLVSKGFVELTFAEPLKRMTAEILGIDYEYIDGRQHREYRENHVHVEWGLTGRQALIKIGEMFRNHFDELTWVKLLKRRLMRIPSDVPVVVSDLRKDNELAALRELGFTIWRVARNHSELTCPKMVNSADVVITNFWTKKELFSTVDGLVGA